MIMFEERSDRRTAGGAPATRAIRTPEVHAERRLRYCVLPSARRGAATPRRALAPTPL
jgi:hypothetical protein